MQEKFDSEPAFEAALVDALTSRYGWQTHTAGLPNVFKGATEADLRTNLARILFLNNRDVDRLNNVELTKTEIGQVIDQINALPSSLADSSRSRRIRGLRRERRRTSRGAKAASRPPPRRSSPASRTRRCRTSRNCTMLAESISPPCRGSP